MEPFTTLTGLVAPLDQINVDTDQIIPAVYLKRITKTGFDDALFAAWRNDPEFVLNQDAGAAIRAETTLSFLGLGIQPPTPSWGNLLTNAATNIFVAPLQVFLPGLFIFFALMSFNLLGDALRDALDPKTERNNG